MNTEEITKGLYECASACNDCYNACLNEEDNEHLHRCMMLDKECYEICRLTGSLIENDSVSTDKFIRLCGEICESCAAECDRHSFEHCKRCAAECRKCLAMCLSFQPVY
jgi:hypothetical protein